MISSHLVIHSSLKYITIPHHLVISSFPQLVPSSLPSLYRPQSFDSRPILYTPHIMTSARDIRPRADDLAAQAQYFSTSPNASFHSPSSHSSTLTRTVPVVNAKHLKPFATEDIKVLLLENVNQAGRDILKQQGYQVEFLKSSLPEDQLIEKIR